MSEVRVVDIPQEVRELYNNDPKLEQLKEGLRSVGGKLGGLTTQFRRKAEPLEAEKARLREQARTRKVELVREHGWAFASLGDLNRAAGCRLHPGAKAVWIPVGKLAEERGKTTVLQGAMSGRRTVDGGTSVRGKLAELRCYELKCTECYLEEKVSPDKAAHGCPNCGIVRGNPRRFHEGATGRYAAYQDSYIYYHCQLCGEELGYVVIHGIER